MDKKNPLARTTNIVGKIIIMSNKIINRFRQPRSRCTEDRRNWGGIGRGF